MRIENLTDEPVSIKPGQAISFQGLVDENGETSVEIESIKPVLKSHDEPCECPPRLRVIGTYLGGLFCNSCGGHLN